jgi:hypothetical protein
MIFIYFKKKIYINYFFFIILIIFLFVFIIYLKIKKKRISFLLNRKIKNLINNTFFNQF